MFLRVIAILLYSCILILAAYLNPDPSGMGTHQQLGLPKCIFLSITHIPCPSCGLTTSFSHIMHGHFWQSFLAHPLGPFLFLFLTFFSIYIALGKSWDKVSRHRFFDPTLYSFLFALGFILMYRIYIHLM